MPNRRPTTLERGITRLANEYGKAAVLGFAKGLSLGGRAVLVGSSISAIASQIFSAMNDKSADKQMEVVIKLEKQCLSQRGLTKQNIKDCSFSQERNRVHKLRSNAENSRKKRDRAVHNALGGGATMFAGKIGEYRGRRL